MKLTKKQKTVLMIVLVVLTTFISCGEANLISEPSKLVSEMSKSELLWDVFFITLVTGLITS